MATHEFVGVLADRPPPSADSINDLYYATNGGTGGSPALFQSNGAAWILLIDFNAFVGGGGGAVASVDGRVGTVTLSDLYQPLDADLTSIAALTTTSFGRGFLALADTTAAVTYLGLPTLTTSDTSKVPISTASGVTTINVVNLQAVDAKLTSFVGLTGAADTLPYFTGTTSMATTSLTTLARTLLAGVNQAAMQTTLGLVPGTNVQAFNANLAAISGLTTANNLMTLWTGSGTATTVDTTTDWLSQYVLGAGRSGSQTIFGSTTAGNGLILQGNSTASRDGGINLRSQVRLLDIVNEALTVDPGPIMRHRQTHTLNFSSGSYGGGATNTLPGLLAFEHTLISPNTAATFLSTILTHNSVYKNANAAAINMGIVTTIQCHHTLQADGAAVTLGAIADFLSAPTLNVINAGTITGGADFVNFEGTVTVQAGATLPLYRAFVAKSPVSSGGGAITQGKGFVVSAVGSSDALSHTGLEVGPLTTAGTNIGLDINAPSGGTLNLGARIAGSVVFLASATQTLAAAGNAILANALTLRLNNTSGGNLTLTSAPTIADGQHCQQVELTNIGANNIVLQDQGTLASSNLRLTTTTVTLAPRQSVRLKFDTTVGDWLQNGTLVAVL